MIQKKKTSNGDNLVVSKNTGQIIWLFCALEICTNSFVIKLNFFFFFGCRVRIYLSTSCVFNYNCYNIAHIYYISDDEIGLNISKVNDSGGDLKFAFESYDDTDKQPPPKQCMS